MKIEIVWSTDEHADYIIANLREIDKLEAWALHRLSPSMAVRGSLFLSEHSYTVLADGRPVLIYGVSPESMVSEQGVVWLLGTDDIHKIKKSFVKRSVQTFKELVSDYTMVYNYVYVYNKIALRWLKWLGFTIHPAKAIGAMGEEFHKVEYRRQ